VRSFTTDQDFTGDYLTPFPLNNEFAEMAQVAHALDSYNFAAASLLVSKLELGALGDLRVAGFQGLTNQVTVTGTAKSSDIYPIPDSSDDPWIELFPSGDGLLKIALSCDIVNITANTQVPCWIGFRVDGNLEGQSGTFGTTNGAFGESFACFGDVFVGAGTHVIEPIFAVYTGSSWTTADLEFNDRILSILEFAR
jgi:hypothetical protein